MSERETEMLEITERNEKNKTFHKRLKRFYIGLILTLFLIILIACMVAKSKIWLCVMGVTFVAWLVWLIYGIFSIRCPHCSAHINRADPFNIRLCPYCGTILKVYDDK